MMRYKILLLAVCFAITHLSAQGLSAGTAIADILGEDEARTDQAVRYLGEACNDSTFRFIDAATGGRLYAYREQALELREDGSYYMLFPVYAPAGNIKKEELKQVKLSRKHKMALNSLMPFVHLTSPSAAKRTEAYRQIATRQDPKSVEYLRTALSAEKDPQALAAARSALHSLLLFNGTETEQQEAIAYFGNQPGHDAHQLLRSYIEKENISPENKSAANKTVAHWDNTERNNHIYQNIFSGLSLGSILVLVALGLSIIYGLAGIINMSHGEFLMIGAYTTYCIQQLFAAYLPEAAFDWAFFLSLPLSFVVTGFFGLVIERLVIRHLYNRPLESLLATWGISLILIQLARSIFGDLTTVKAPAILSGGWTLADGLMLPYNRLFIIALTLIIFSAVFLLFKKSRLGIKIRAATQNRNMSACVGISTKKIDMMTFMLGSGLAGVAGCAITLIGNVVPDMGQTYIVDSFLVVVTGGVGKLAGCVASGLGIGVLSKAFEAGFEAVYGKVFLLLLIIIFLQYRPKGLFPDKGRIGDD